MKCKKCGKEFEGNFCPYCGTPANPEKEICPVCGKEREEGSRYCSGCGHDFYSVSQKSKMAAAGVVAKVKNVPKKTWIILSVVLVAVIAIVVAIVLLTSFFSNKFRIGVVEQINIGDSKQQVIDLLGEPYGDDENSSVFEYYSDNYLSLLEENDSFNPDDIEDFDDLENAFGDALELEQKLQTEEYQYIEVRFDSEGTVTSVFFDAARTEETKDEPKTIKNYEVLSDISNMANVVENLEYLTYYSDGSYYIGTTSISLNFEDEVFVAEWRDNYGNNYKYNLGIGASQYDEATHTLQIFIDYGFNNIPEDVENVIIYDGITSIADQAFSGCTSLTSITIPDSVTSIGSGAFYGCTSLESITIPDSVTFIGEDAFRCFNIKEATIPAFAIEYIPQSRLQTVTITSGSTIESEAFKNCHSLKSIIIGNSVTSIGGSAFYSCDSLTSINIPNSVTSIGSYAFYECELLTSINIPDSVTSIGGGAFDGCTLLEAVYITDIAAWCNIEFTRYDSNPLYYAHNLYFNGELVTDLVIPDGVTSIGSRAFEDCTSIASVTIPDSVTSIGGDAFSGCTALTSVTIGNGVTFIDYGAFSGCRSLTSIIIPKSVTSIGSYAFNGCYSLTILCEATAKPNGWADDWCAHRSTLIGPFVGFNHRAPVVWDCNNNDIANDGYIYAIINNIRYGLKNGTATVAVQPSNITEVNIPAHITYKNSDYSVTNIGYAAFSGCTLLTGITIPDSVTSIDNYAFYSCDLLASITIPDSVTSIGSGAFEDCTSLTSITIPDGITSIGYSTFEGCTSLTSITIPDSVKSIGEDTFYDCTALTSITLPDSITSIGYYAFNGCDSLETVYYTGSEDQWNAININNSYSGNTDLLNAHIVYNYNGSTSDNEDVTVGTEGLEYTLSDDGTYYIVSGIGTATETDIVIPSTYNSLSVKEIGDSAFYNCTALESITIPDSVTSIGKEAFYGCQSLTSITIPDSVTSIGSGAFVFCYSLTIVAIGDSVTSIGDWAFWECNSLETVYYTGSEKQWDEISFGRGSKYLLNADIVYNYEG